MPIDIFSDSHAALYFLYNKLPSAVKKAADLIRHGLLIWLFVEMMIYGMTINQVKSSKTPACNQDLAGVAVCTTCSRRRINACV